MPVPRLSSPLPLSLLVSVLAAAFAARVVLAQHASGVRLHSPVYANAEARTLESSPAEAGPDIYIVQLVEPALASYRGGISGLVPTSPSAIGRNRLDPSAPPSRAYLAYLDQRQASVWSAIQQLTGGTSRLLHNYRFAFNGLAVELAPEDARRAEALSGVLRVERNVWLRYETHAGPAWIGAPGIWDGSTTGGLPGTRGEGIIIGVIDTGINSNHPSFADLGGDGYDHPPPPGGFRGWCNPSHPNSNPAVVCNDKLMGQYSYALSDNNPEDDFGHGSHVASIAVGNVAMVPFVAPTTTMFVPISGVAPHAHLITYDVFRASGSAPTAAILAGIDDATADTVDVINYSISFPNEDPWTNSASVAFLGAVDAGIAVVTSAGNTGPAPGSVTRARGPWLLLVGATTHHGRLFLAHLTNLQSDAASLPDIQGAGLTASLPQTSIVYAGDFPNPNDPLGDAGQCMQPYPAGTFSGQIVICDRGTISRITKGGNVLAGGAGGFVLANRAVEGESIVGEGHLLPAVHIGFAASITLKAWVAANTGTRGASDVEDAPTSEPALADFMGGFSSRGPRVGIDVIGPDIAAPGVNVLAALNDTPPGSTGSNPFGFMSGTSMASPHTAGSAALLRALHPPWSPAEVKSALMTTAFDGNSLIKEDLVTPADPFDRGAGRVDLSQAGNTGLVLDVTSAEFTAANPATGGDPRTLNLPSMQDSACYQACSWSRTVENATGTAQSWSLDYSGPGEAAFTGGATAIPPGGSMTFGLDLDTIGLGRGWHFGRVELSEASGVAADVHMPVAFRATTSTGPGSFRKSVDRATADPGDTLTYTLKVSNPAGPQRLVDVTDPIPANATYVAGSATGGLVYDPGSETITGSIVVDPLQIEIQETSGSGFVSLSSLGVSPYFLPSNCDNGGWIFRGLDFDYGGENYTQLTWSVNGTIEVGAASGFSTAGANTPLPTADVIDNLLAPWWTDLNLCGGGRWYIAFVDVGSNTYFVLEWNDVPRTGDASSRATFQAWILMGGEHEHVFFAYPANALAGSTSPATVGAENSDGSVGDTYYFNGSGTLPSGANDLVVGLVGPVTMTFQVIADAPGQVLNQALASYTTPTPDGRGAGTLLEAFALTVIENPPLFADGFESGDTSAWSRTVSP